VVSNGSCRVKGGCEVSFEKEMHGFKLTFDGQGWK